MTESYVTVATDDITCLGCLVLCNSLKQTGTEKKISVLVFSNVSQHLRNVLQKSFDYLFYVNDLCLSNGKDDFLNNLKDYQKLKCWLLVQFNKCVFLESDVLVVENIDDLFERNEFSAVTDSRWPDSFDVGVFVFKPNSETYSSIIDYFVKYAKVNTLQELLNKFFSNWNIVNIEHKIPFIYNCQLNFSFYTHTNALVHFGRSIKAARLGNSVVDMMQPLSFQDANYENWNRLWLLWWKIFNEMVKPSLMTNETQDFNRIDWGNDKFCRDKSPTRSNFTTSQTHESNVDEHKEHQVVNDIPNYVSIPEFPSHDKQKHEQHQVHHCSNETTSGGYHNMPNDIPNYTTISEFPSDDKQKHEQILLHETKSVDHKSDSEANIPIDDGGKVGNVSVLSDSEKDEEIENNHRQQWERGEIDYMGKDCFQNILTKLNAKIKNQNVDSTVNSEE